MQNKKGKLTEIVKSSGTLVLSPRAFTRPDMRGREGGAAHKLQPEVRC